MEAEDRFLRSSARHVTIVVVPAPWRVADRRRHGVNADLDSFDLVLVGTGFATTFFLHRYLAHAAAAARVLVLERGAMRDHSWQIAHDGQLEAESQKTFVNRTPQKPWTLRIAFGGCSNCWWACTPRFLPEDFKLHSLYGVGQDWPITYDDLEEYYCDAEELMEVSGPTDGSPYPRSRPYPQPPHRFSNPDRLLKRRFPEAFFNQPAARPSRASKSGRSQCCASGVCRLCPINSKFTILNELNYLYEDPRVTLVTGAHVLSLDIANNLVTGARYRLGGTEHVARGEVVGLGANAVFNPHILLRSGLSDPALGRGLVEQASARVDVLLDGVDNFQGSTSITGLGYMLYGGEHRRERAAALMESWNTPELRNERGKWRQRVILKFIYEDLPQVQNRVTVNADNPDLPDVSYESHSPYLERGLLALESQLPSILKALPVERYQPYLRSGGTEAHILGTTAMGSDPATHVVDADLVHHRVRNLLVLGGSVFPTIAPANPTLTICALSLRAADRLRANR
jgi:choline dehydrogenase-like flavoprotein